jgi:hypothetical protein
MSKDELARVCGISRSTLYYVSKQDVKDWHTKTLIETALVEHQSYGHKRLALHLHLNKKRILRVMKKYGKQAIPQSSRTTPQTRVETGLCVPEPSPH